MTHDPFVADLTGSGSRYVLFGFFVLGNSVNNFNPTLVLHPTHVEFGGLRTTTAPYTDVELIDVRRNNLFMDRRSTNKRFMAAFRDTAQLRYAVQLFGSHGCPLSARAQQLAA